MGTSKVLGTQEYWCMHMLLFKIPAFLIFKILSVHLICKERDASQFLGGLKSEFFIIFVKASYNWTSLECKAIGFDIVHSKIRLLASA